MFNYSILVTLFYLSPAPPPPNPANNSISVQPKFVSYIFCALQQGPWLTFNSFKIFTSLSQNFCLPRITLLDSKRKIKYLI